MSYAGRKALEEISGVKITKTYIPTANRPQITEEIVTKIRSINDFYTLRNDDKTEIWRYEEGIYKPNGATYIKEKVREVLGEAYTTQLANEVINKIATDTYIEPQEFFDSEQGELVAVNNGLLNPNDKSLQEFTPKKIFFNKLPVNYNEQAKCPKILTFLNEVLPNKEDIKIIQELAGWLLFNKYTYDKAILLVGEGRNGKSVTIRLLQELLGRENYSTVPLQTISNDQFACADLFGKRANFGGDLPNTAIKDSSLFKGLTGGDMMRGNRKFLNAIIFRNNAKIINACNEVPITYDQTLAFFNRWIIIIFPFTFLLPKDYEALPEEEKNNYRIANPHLREELTTQEELEGLLVWAIRGYQRLKKQQGFSYSKTTEETKETWLKKSDSVLAFCMEQVEESFEGRISKQKFKQEYHNYCKKNKLKPKGDKHIKQTLTHNYPVQDTRAGKEQVSYWEGIVFSILNDTKSTGKTGKTGNSTLKQKLDLPIGKKTLFCLFSLFTSEPIPTGTIAEELGEDTTIVYEILQELAVKGDVIESKPDRWSPMVTQEEFA